MKVKVSGINGLNKFTNILNNISSIDKLLDKIVDIVAIQGAMILTKNYSNTEIKGEIPQVSVDNQGRVAFIDASGKDVMFIEFGTGTKGQESNYQGNFPENGVPITGKWEYNYPSKFKKVNKQGRIYWTFMDSNGNFINSQGQSCGQQIFDTARELETIIPQIVKQVLDKEF